MLVRSHEKLTCNELVIGGGGAGMRSAIAAKLRNTDVLLTSKTKRPRLQYLYIQGHHRCNRMGDTGR
jgi:succinate dehydrogenase/fumarate reductase flavoprotein subunit